ncbi:MAG: hypothetical protein DMD59_01855 [Gemmatimonadetes bacterium]|nr:MAG: hypothetical protein DMD59_01855 [Gemmatimonadota bacterium]
MMEASRVSANLLTVYDVWRAFGCNFAPPSFLYASAMRTAAASTALAVILALGCGDSGTEPTGLRRVQIVGTASLTHFLVNDTARVSLAGYDKNGASYPAGPVTWRSSDPTVLSIDTAGLVVARALGSATITGSVGTVSDSFPIQVAGTRHRWPITANETWTLAASPHVVKGRLAVGGAGGVTLTIDAGATVQLHYVTVSGCGQVRTDDQPVGCLVLGHRFSGASPTLLVDHVTVQDAAGGAVILQSTSRFTPGSSALSVQRMHGYIATMPAGAAGEFPLGGTFSANDSNEVRLTRDTLRDSTVWAAGPPWIVLDPIYIEGPRQPVLTIPAGVTLPFAFGASLVVGNNGPGGLRIGTDGGAAVSLAPRSGTWAGLAFYPAALASAVTNATLDDCGNYGSTGYGQACVSFIGNFFGTAPTPVFKNVTIRGAVDVGVNAIGGGRFGDGSANVTITGTHGSIGAPIWLWGSSPASIPSGGYSGNAMDVIYVIYGEVTQTETWPNPGVPYLIRDGLGIGHAANPRLTLDPGVVLRFAPGGILSVGWLVSGNVRAIGTDSEPIIFTGQYDFAGSWMGVMVGPYADTTTAFDHVIVQNGGADDGQFATGFRLAREMGPFIRNTLVQRSAGCGITRLSGSTWTTDFTAPALGNTFQNNAGAAQCGP